MDNLTNKKKFNEYDIAYSLAIKKFEERHPKEKQPEWLERYFLITGIKNEHRNWIIRKILFHKIQLKPNQRWEQSLKGNPLLIEVDPITKKESVNISGGYPADFEVIFEVEINLANHSVTVLVDTDLNKLVENKYQVQRV